MTPPWQGVDEAIFRELHLVWRHPTLDPLFRILTDPGKLMLPLLLVLLGALWMQRKRGLIALLALALTIGAADQLSAKILKPIFARQRPSVVVAESHPFFGVRRSYSFPSVHATNAFAAALVLDAVFPGLRAAFLVVAALVSYSRIYVGDHWPSDVVAGALLGAFVGMIGRIFFLRLARRFASGADTVSRGGGAPNAAR